MNQTQKPSRRFHLFSGRAFLILMPVLAIAIVPAVFYFKYSDIPFDSKAWKLADTKTRARMINDLERSRLLLGLTTEEVEQHLGPPKSMPSTNNNSNSTIWYYGIHRKTFRSSLTFRIIYEGNPPVVADYGMMD